MGETLPQDDPLPVPPSPPDFDECCGSGCEPCIFEVYDRALARYRGELKAWQQRHPEPPPS